MSHTIHSIPRTNLPQTNTRLVMKAMAAIQDATTFQEARDALLRYYYPLLRTKTRNTLPEDKNTDIYNLDFTHSERNSVQLLQENVLESNSTLSPVETDYFQKKIEDARKDKSMAPYERVGHILEALKEWKAKQPSRVVWKHTMLRQWMQGLLLDFTLADAKTKPGAMLNNPEQHYINQIQLWDKHQSSLPWNKVCSLNSWSSDLYKINNSSMSDTQKEVFLEQVRQANTKALHIRAEVSLKSDPAAVFLTHTHLGVIRTFGASWRDVTDYGVLHPLLTLDEKTFDKSVWLEWLQHGKWSTPEKKATWYAWQEEANISYQQILQAEYGSTPDMLLKRGTDNPLLANASSPLKLDWSLILQQLTDRFPYLNQSSELENVAKRVLQPEELLKFISESDAKVGQNLIQSLMELPDILRTHNAFNQPAWLHHYLKQFMTVQPSLELPQGLVDSQIELDASILGQ